MLKIENEKINEKIKEFLDIKTTIDELTDKSKSLKKEIEYHMKENNETVYTDIIGNKVTLCNHSQNRLDTKAVKEFLGEEKVTEFTKQIEMSFVKIVSKESNDIIKQFVK